MAPRVVLVELQPRRPADGVAVPLRVIGGVTDRADHFGQQWLPALARFPRLSSRLGFDGRAFGEGAVTAAGDIAISLGSAAIAPFTSYLYDRAAVTVKTGPAGGVDGDFTTLWTGRAAGAAVAGKQLVVRLADPAEDLRVPALPNQFAGTGGLEGPAELKGRVKPRAWGTCEGVPAILIDSAFGIYLLIETQATVSAVYDGGVAFTAGPAAADLAALQALTVPAGAVATSSSALGTLIRPWTRPTFTMTADIVAGALTKPAEIASAIVTGRAAVVFATGQVAAYDAAQPGPIGTFIDDERTLIDELDRIFAGLGSWWDLNAAGDIEVGQFGFGASAQSFEFELADIARTALLTPTRKRLVGYRRNFRPLTDSEIAGILTDENAERSGVTSPLVKNGGFEAGDRDWSKGTGWSIVEGETALAGTWSAKLVSTGLNSTATNSQSFGAHPGERFLARCQIFAAGATAGKGRVRIAWFDAAGVFLSFSAGSAVDAGAAGWSQSRVSAVAPANAASGVASIVCDNAPVGTWYFDQVRVTEELADADVDALGTTNGPADAGATNGAPGLIPPGVKAASGTTTIELVPNQDGGGAANDGEIRVRSGFWRLPDGTTRTIVSNSQINTNYEGSVANNPRDGVFYIFWGATDANARFPALAGAFGSSGLFSGEYDRVAKQWFAVDNLGDDQAFAPLATDYIFAIGTKTLAGGIGSLTQIVGRTEGFTSPGVIGTNVVKEQSTGGTNRRVPIGAAKDAWRDGVAVNFTNAWPAAPLIGFDDGGVSYDPALGAVRQERVNAALNVTTSGFTASLRLKAAGTSVPKTDGPGSQVGGTPAWQITKSVAAEDKNDTYIFNVTLDALDCTFGGDPEFGSLQVGFYTRTVIGGLWTQRASNTYQRTSGTKSLAVVVDGLGSGAAFGVHHESGICPNNGISAFVSVTYDTGVAGGDVSAALAAESPVKAFVIGDSEAV